MAVGNPECCFAIPGPLRVHVVVSVATDVDGLGFAIGCHHENVLRPAVLLQKHGEEVLAVGRPGIGDVAVDVGIRTAAVVQGDARLFLDVINPELHAVLEIGDGLAIGRIERLEGFLISGDKRLLSENG